jgi:maltose alpha-D-glucosyltransferase/alpha-amylase
MDAAELLGRRTAEMHIALSSSPNDPAFAPEASSQDDLERDARQIESQIRSALEALKSKFSTLDESASDGAALLLSKRRELVERSHSIESLSAAGQRIRIHGDYHLGQTLRTEPRTPSTDGANAAGDFVLLDFEGEPARPLSERRRKQSPLKDVAGMLRSFSYVAFAALKAYLDAGAGKIHPETVANLHKWSHAWQNSASAAFLRAYRENIAGNPDVLPPVLETQTLLDAFVLEKALYELLYELNNRPAWIHIPIAGILSLCR